MNTPFLDQVVDAWNSQKIPGIRSNIRRVPNNSALIIEIHGQRVLATIEAWESASCLDVTTLDLATGHGSIHSCGETKAPEEMQRRIEMLREILLKYEARDVV